ncbi:MAG: hypothetical protein K2K82_04040, partial [Muribaculaceae bacterium]|nr:hypothetical protein [Muribaculaceae bacterium]
PPHIIFKAQDRISNSRERLGLFYSSNRSSISSLRLSRNTSSNRSSINRNISLSSRNISSPRPRLSNRSPFSSFLRLIPKALLC